MNLDQLQAHIMSGNYETVLRRYMQALGASDYATIKSLFAEDGTVTSPFLGLMPARDFFDRLGGRDQGQCHHPDRRVPAERRPAACGGLFPL